MGLTRARSKFDPRQTQRFFLLHSIHFEPEQPPIQKSSGGSEGYFPSGKVNSSWNWRTPTNVEVKNIRKFTSNSHTPSRRGASLRRWKSVTVIFAVKVPRGCIMKLSATKPGGDQFGNSKSSHLWMGFQVDRAGFISYKYGSLDARKTSVSQYRSLSRYKMSRILVKCWLLWHRI